MPKISVLIVNWNGKHHLPDCLDGLAGQSFRDFETVLVDNGSADGSVEFVRERYPWVRVVPLERNTGFATGNNVALAHAEGEYLVTLNNDTRAEPGWLAELVAAAGENPRAGMIASRIVAFDDFDRIDSIGVTLSPDGMSRGAGRDRRFSGLSLGRTEPILIPSACAALYKRAMVEAVGFFDDAFFAYCEDTDLGLRGRLAGWEALLARDAVVRHKYSGTGGVFTPLKLFLVERNHYWVAAKTFPAPMLAAVPLWTFVRFAVQARLILRGAGVGGQFRRSGSTASLAGAVLRGVGAAVAGLPDMLRKRAAARRRRTLSDREWTRLLRRYRLSFRDLLE